MRLFETTAVPRLVIWSELTPGSSMLPSMIALRPGRFARSRIITKPLPGGASPMPFDNTPKCARVDVQRPPLKVNDLPPTRTTARPGPQYLEYPGLSSVPHPPENRIARRCVSAAEHSGGSGNAASAAHAPTARATRLAVTIAVRIPPRVWIAFSAGSTRGSSGEIRSAFVSAVLFAPDPRRSDLARQPSVFWTGSARRCAAVPLREILARCVFGQSSFLPRCRCCSAHGRSRRRTTCPGTPEGRPS